jgi:hypothetical protein
VKKLLSLIVMAGFLAGLGCGGEEKKDKDKAGAGKDKAGAPAGGGADKGKMGDKKKDAN